MYFLFEIQVNQMHPSGYSCRDSFPNLRRFYFSSMTIVMSMIIMSTISDVHVLNLKLVMAGQCLVDIFGLEKICWAQNGDSRSLIYSIVRLCTLVRPVACSSVSILFKTLQWMLNILAQIYCKIVIPTLDIFHRAILSCGAALVLWNSGWTE